VVPPIADVIQVTTNVVAKREECRSLRGLYRVFTNFYNPDLLLGKRVSEQAIQVSWNVAAGASAAASLGCVRAWQEDFREDRKRIDVPTLVIHGDADRIVPISVGIPFPLKRVTTDGRTPGRRQPDPERSLCNVTSNQR
jgi:pimeloyl-ACP methyl ester carboxylesterase